MKKLGALLKSVYLNPTVQSDAKDLGKVVIGVLLVHFGLKAS